MTRLAWRAGAVACLALLGGALLLAPPFAEPPGTLWMRPPRHFGPGPGLAFASTPGGEPLGPAFRVRTFSSPPSSLLLEATPPFWRAALERWGWAAPDPWQGWGYDCDRPATSHVAGERWFCFRRRAAPPER